MHLETVADVTGTFVFVRSTSLTSMYFCLRIDKALQFANGIIFFSAIGESKCMMSRSLFFLYILVPGHNRIHLHQSRGTMYFYPQTHLSIGL